VAYRWQVNIGEKKMTQLQTLKAAFNRGEKLTVLTALKRYQTLSLSQRVGNLIDDGFPVDKGWLLLKNGKRVRTYQKRRKS
jgi:hypothetical protein